VAAFEDEWRLMQQGYTSNDTPGRARRLTRRMLSVARLGRRPAAPVQIGPELP
jgi:hypothetical protein